MDGHQSVRASLRHRSGSPPNRLQLLTWIGCILALAIAAPRARAADPTTQPAARSSEAAELKKLSLKELMEVQVSTLSRVDERIDEAPGSVYVYSRDVIQQRGYRSLGQLLQVVPGFTVFHRDIEFVAGVRGLNANDNEKISLLINGQNVNGVYEPDFLNGPINLDNVERVEVVVGPSSLFQPANTLAATVNVITKDVEGADVIAGIGNDLKYSTTTMFGHRWAPDRYLGFSFTTEEKRGFDAWDLANRPTLSGRRITGQLEQPNYFGIVKGQYGELTGQFTAYRTTMPELNIDNGDPSNNGVLSDSFYSIYLKAEHAYSKTLTTVITADATLKDFSRTNRDGPPINAVELTLKQWVFNTDWSIRYTGIDRHSIQAGVQASYDNNFSDWFTFNSTPTNEHIPQTTLFSDDTYAIGFYADDEFKINEQWKLIGGVRADRNTRLEPDRWYPGWRSAVVYEPTPDWVTKLIYNRAVRMPGALAALNRVWGINNNINSPTNPSFAHISATADQPEILTTLEWQNIIYLQDMRIGLTVYHQELEDFMSWFEPHTNIGNFRGNGVELSLQAPVRDDLTLWANGSYNDSTLNPFNSANLSLTNLEQHVLINPDGRIIGAPAFTANLGLDYYITRHLVFSPSLRYFTEQAARSAGNFEIIRNRFYVDATLVWKNIGGKDLDFRLSGYNLLNNRDPVAGQWLADTYQPQGITFVASLEWRF